MEFIRGDTWLFKFKIKSVEKEITDKADIQSLFVTVKKNQYTQKVTVQKQLDDVTITSDGYVHVKFSPRETEQIQPGEYCADIEVTLTDGVRKTKLLHLGVVHDITTHGGDSNA